MSNGSGDMKLETVSSSDFSLNNNSDYIAMSDFTVESAKINSQSGNIKITDSSFAYSDVHVKSAYVTLFLWCYTCLVRHSLSIDTVIPLKPLPLPQQASQCWDVSIQLDNFQLAWNTGILREILIAGLTFLHTKITALVWQTKRLFFYTLLANRLSAAPFMPIIYWNQIFKDFLKKSQYPCLPFWACSPKNLGTSTFSCKYVHCTGSLPSLLSQQHHLLGKAQWSHASHTHHIGQPWTPGMPIL